MVAASATTMSADPDDETPQFSQVLRAARQRRGIKQRALAVRAEIDPTTLNRMENGGQHQPRVETVMRLVNALDLSPEEPDAKLLFAAAGIDPAVAEGYFPRRAPADDLRTDDVVRQVEDLRSMVARIQMMLDGLSRLVGATGP